MRDADVQHPNRVFTPDASNSRARWANVSGSDAPSAITGSMAQPSTPPRALISSTAIRSASNSGRSLNAMVPLSECSRPTWAGRWLAVGARSTVTLDITRSFSLEDVASLYSGMDLRRNY